MSALRSVTLRAAGPVGAGVTNETPVSDFNSRDTPHLILRLAVSAVPSGGTPTLDVYLQFSPDGGTTWQDMTNVQFGSGTRWFRINGDTAGNSAIEASSDGALVNTARQGPFGGLLRIKSNFVVGGSSGNYDYTAVLYFK